ncbi:MAG: diguanylate cyclase [Chloroflexota bacterium]|nr:diguanylate cyclase [Chloroflexota bacterium]
MDRPRAAAGLRMGARLVAVLLPLAALAALRLASADALSLQSWVMPTAAAIAAAITGAAVVPTAATALHRGRIGDLADATGLAVLTVLLGVVAVNPHTESAITAGLFIAGVVFVAGSLAGEAILANSRTRWGGAIAIFAPAESSLGGIQLVSSGSIGGTGSQLLGPAAAVLLLAATALARTTPARATALGVLTSAAVAQALASPGGVGSLTAPAGLALGAALVGWHVVTREVLAEQEASRAATERLVPLLAPAATWLEPEHESESRMAYELRGTIEELINARRLVQLQRLELERTAKVDRLTGLATRDTIVERLAIEAAEARRYAHPVALVLVDIDAFTALNHEHGLEVGDALLREVALRMRLRMREADALGRIGPDAFLAILPHTDERGATALAEALRSRVIDRPLLAARGELTVSVSIGIALMRPGMSFTDEELLGAAEEALASARAAGGNRIAFDRLHGLARLDERRGAEPDGAGDRSIG